MWKPFDSRFQVILASIDLHAEVVKEELHFATMGQLRSAFQNQAEHASNRQREYLARLESLQQEQSRQAQGKVPVSYQYSHLRIPDALLMTFSLRDLPKVGHDLAQRPRVQS